MYDTIGISIKIVELPLPPTAILGEIIKFSNAPKITSFRHISMPGSSLGYFLHPLFTGFDN